MSWLIEHTEEFIEKFAREDNTTPDEWKQKAIFYVVRQRVLGEAKSKNVDDLSELLDEGIRNGN